MKAFFFLTYHSHVWREFPTQTFLFLFQFFFKSQKQTTRMLGKILWKTFIILVVATVSISNHQQENFEKIKSRKIHITLLLSAGERIFKHFNILFTVNVVSEC
jgi:hypothetical protein